MYSPNFLAFYQHLSPGVVSQIQQDGTVCGPEYRQTNITYYCNLSATTPILTQAIESVACQYQLSVDTDQVCGAGFVSNGSSSSVCLASPQSSTTYSSSNIDHVVQALVTVAIVALFFGGVALSRCLYDVSNYKHTVTLYGMIDLYPDVFNAITLAKFAVSLWWAVVGIVNGEEDGDFEIGLLTIIADGVVIGLSVCEWAPFLEGKTERRSQDERMTFLLCFYNIFASFTVFVSAMAVIVHYHLAVEWTSIAILVLFSASATLGCILPMGYFLYLICTKVWSWLCCESSAADDATFVNNVKSMKQWYKRTYFSFNELPLQNCETASGTTTVQTETQMSVFTAPATPPPES